jgi:DNA-binding CsgD family transcriptional regulator
VHEARDLCASLIPHATGRGLVGLCLAGAYTCGVGGRLSDACRISELGLTTHLAYEGPPFLWPPGVHRFIRIDALSLMGRLGEAERLGTDWYATAVNEGSAIEQAYVTSGLSKTFRRQGRVRTAARWARLSERLFREEGRPAERSYDLIYLAHALALAGSYDEAEAVLGEYDGLPGSGGAEFGPEVLQARAWVCVAGGDLTRATAFLTEAAELARAQGSLATECEFLHDLARLGLGAEVAARLRQVARSVEGPLAPARVVHVDAVISRNPGGLETASQAFEDLGALLLAAEGAADAAVAWRGRREPRKAAAAERRAGLLAERCEGARTPGLIAAPARALLSARELEIARLAAAGIPNKEIAARLYLSVRTVENKLHTAYEKLGVDGRAELAEALEGY